MEQQWNIIKKVQSSFSNIAALVFLSILSLILPFAGFIYLQEISPEFNNITMSSDKLSALLIIGTAAPSLWMSYKLITRMQIRAIRKLLADSSALAKLL
jgi:hypothetical protein